MTSVFIDFVVLQFNRPDATDKK